MRYFLFLFSLLPFAALAQQPAGLLLRLKNAPESQKVKILIELSAAYTESQPDSAVHYAQAGIKLAEKLGNQKGQALLLLQIGEVNAFHHHTELARKFYNEALGIFRSMHDAQNIAYTYDKIGLLDGEEQNVSRATHDLQQAMTLYGDSRDSTGILETYADLARVYEEKGNIDKALSYYLRALVLYEQHKMRPDAYYIVLENIGNLYLKKGDKKTALHYLQEGVHDSDHDGRRDTEVYLMDEEGKVYQDEGKQPQALKMYKEALTEAKKFNQPGEEVKALINIASLLKNENAATSLNDLRQALDIAQKIHQPQLRARIYEAMAGVYRQEKNYREAMNALEEQRHLLDSLLQANTAKDIAALDSSYALQDSLEKIGHLQKVNKRDETALQLGQVILAAIAIILALLWLYLRKMKRLNLELKTSNRVKDTLFSVIGHDLKGPAASAANLFELMETEDFTETELRGMIAELRKQTTASLELLQALFEWGNAQLRGVDVKPVDFDPKPVIERCISLLSQQASQKNIRISDQTPGYMRLYADADHFEFVIRNLVSNAIKFSHEGGAIEIDAGKGTAQKEIIFSIRDHGIGISKGQQEVFLTSNLKVSFGTRKEKGSGLGLLLTKDFVKADKGRIWLESEEGEGTTFHVALPAA